MAAKTIQRQRRLECSTILERHDALSGTEVALVRCHDGMFGIELITPKGDGQFARDAIGGCFGTKRSAERLLMAAHNGVVVAQRAAL